MPPKARKQSPLLPYSLFPIPYSLLFQPFLEFKGKAMSSGRKKDLKGRLVFAFYPKKRAASGKCGIPAYLKMPALKAVGGSLGKILLVGGLIAHSLI
jgi:hypothetical protein